MGMPIQNKKFRKLIPLELDEYLPVLFCMIEQIPPKPKHVVFYKYKASHFYQTKRLRVTNCYKPISKIIVYGG